MVLLCHKPARVSVCRQQVSTAVEFQASVAEQKQATPSWRDALQPGPRSGGAAARWRQPCRSGLCDFAGFWSGGVGLVLLRPGGRAAASGGLLEAVTVAVHRQDADVVAEPSRADAPLHRAPFAVDQLKLVQSQQIAGVIDTVPGASISCSA
jgi:hypothetical protein